jgi:hypothetical protein
MRLQQLISARICEYTYLIQQVMRIFTKEVISKNLSKKAKLSFAEKPEDKAIREKTQQTLGGSVADLSDL